jgi:hypothetical protein
VRRNATGLSCYLLLAITGLAIAQSDAEPPKKADRQPESQQGDTARMRDYAPGVRIDWAERAVDIDARVVLREGALELLACTPHTREHESIFVVGARPLHIHQALGLIGFQPGRPLRYDEKSEQWHAPFGEPLSITVSCTGEKETTHPARAFLKLTDKNESPDMIDWVWAGSRVLENGQFGADTDGTVICVVDFDTALISVGALHTSDNEALWLEARTEIIPPVDTPCVIRLKSRRSDNRVKEKPAADAIERNRQSGSEQLLVEFVDDDVIRLETLTLSVNDFIARFDKAKPHRPALRVRVGPSVSRASVDKMLVRLRDHKFDRITIDFAQQGEDQKRQSESSRHHD